MEGVSRKQSKKSSAPTRRSHRIQSQAKPSPGLVAAKKTAQQRMGSKKETVFNFVKDIYQGARDSKDMVRQETGVVYDSRMVEHSCEWDPDYPERGQRVEAVIARATQLALIDRCRLLEPAYITVEELSCLHTPAHVSLLAQSTTLPTDKLEELSSKYDSIYINRSTYECSLLAGGCAVTLIDNICKGTIQNGMAIIRPPGHHAMSEEYCGYCFFNNAALAANHALSLGVNSILIVDWDVHHGQATQQMFYNDPRVLYFSIHRYEEGKFWPNLRESDYDSIGEGAGKGFNINVPLNTTGLSDIDYLAIFHNLLIPIAYEYGPELVIVSAGYDAALGCPEGEMELSPGCYAHMTSALMGLAGGKVGLLLEGGYCLESLAEGAALSLRALLGDPCPSLSLGPRFAPHPAVVATLGNLSHVLTEHWRCIDPMGPPPGPPPPVPPPPGPPYPTRACYPVQSPALRSSLLNRLSSLQASARLLSPPHKLCFVYDPVMMLHTNYEESDHLEKPERISAIYKMLELYNLLPRIHRVQSREASEEELLYAHSREHVEEMKGLGELGKNELIKKKQIYQSVYLHKETWRVARLGAGSLLSVVDAVLSGESGAGVALVRPPGHHADIDEPCGFCIFNNIAIAAKYAIANYNLSRVLILDWDVHHGNGTQEIFYEDKEVLYVSVHRYDHGEFFPPSGDGAATMIGRAPALGYNINIPWNKSGMSDPDYVEAFHKVVLPVAYQFQPELVLVSAGFDAAAGDPLGGCKVSPECFAHMTHWLSRLACGRLVLSLEGGYNVNSVAYSMTECAKALLGDPLIPLRSGLCPSGSALASIREVVDTQAAHWSCLDTIPPSLDPPHTLMHQLSLAESLPGPSTTTLSQFIGDNIQALLNEEMYAVVPLSWCPHLEVGALPSPPSIQTSTPCQACADPTENWVCLTCYIVLCGRHVNEDMVRHNTETGHPLVLSFSDLSVWCYPCQSYIDHQMLYGARNKVHQSKFGSELVWSYSAPS